MIFALIVRVPFPPELITQASTASSKLSNSFGWNIKQMSPYFSEPLGHSWSPGGGSVRVVVMVGVGVVIGAKYV